MIELLSKNKAEVEVISSDSKSGLDEALEDVKVGNFNSYKDTDDLFKKVLNVYKILTTKRFEKSLKLCQKRHYDLNLLKEVIDSLARTGVLSTKYKSHKLSGNYKNCWECHIKPDWLLIWQ